MPIQPLNLSAKAVRSQPSAMDPIKAFVKAHKVALVTTGVALAALAVAYNKGLLPSLSSRVSTPKPDAAPTADAAAALPPMEPETPAIPANLTARNRIQNACASLGKALGKAPEKANDFAAFVYGKRFSPYG